MTPLLCISLIIGTGFANPFLAPSQTFVTPQIPHGYLLITRKEAQSFQEICASFCQKSKSTLIFEGRPFITTISDADADRLVTQLVTIDNEEQIIGKIATAYDYEAKRFDNKGWLLFKHYSSPQDIPPVTFDEYYQCLDEIEKIIAPYRLQEDSSSVNDHLLIPLAKSITPKSLKPYTDLGHPFKETVLRVGISVQSLPMEQQQQVEQLGRYLYLNRGPLKKCSETYLHLKAIQEEKVTFRHIEKNGTKLFGYEVPLRINDNEPYFLPLCYPAQVETLGMEFGVWSISNIPAGQKDPTDPSSTSIIESLNEARIPQTTDLKQLIGRWNRQDSPNSLFFSIEKRLENKEVTIFGEEYQPHNRVFSAISEMYGTQIRTENTKQTVTKSLRYRPVIAAKSCNDLPYAVEKTIPPTILRYFRKITQKIRDKQRKNPQSGTPEFTREMRKEIKEATNNIRIVSLLAIRKTIEPLLNGKNTQAVPLTKEDIRNHNLLATQWFMSVFPYLFDFCTLPPPDFIAHPENLYAIFDWSRDPESGEKSFGIFFARKTEEGQISQSGGGVGVMFDWHDF